MKPKQSSIFRFLTICIAPVIAGMTSPSASAATRTWDGEGGNNLLNNATNWSDNALPNVAGDVARWNGSPSGNLTLTADGGWAVGGGNGGGTSILVTSLQTGSLVIGGNQNIGLGATVDVESGAGAVTINPTAQLVFRGGNAAITNESVNLLTFGANIANWNNGGGVARSVTFGGSGNTQIDGNFVLGGANVFNPLTKIGAGTLTLNGAQNGGLAGVGTTMAALVITEGTMKFGNAARIASDGILGNYTSAITIDGTLDWSSSATQTFTGAITGGGEIKQSAGSLTLTGTNGFFGTTTITGGSLTVGGGGSIDSDIIVNGTTAKFFNTSTVAAFQPITLTLGSVGGSGSIGPVTVADNAGAAIANGNGSGGSATLTLESLAFSGDGAFSITEDGDTSTPGVNVTGQLTTTPGSGTITVNASNLFWNSDVTYELVNAGSFSPAFSLSHFTLGTINGVTGRQSPSLVATPSGVGLLITGDNPKWSGADSTNWVVGSTGPNGNWRLISSNAKTDYIQGDVVFFDDSANNATVTVTISAADVSPAVVNFNNSKPYTLNGPFGIATGAINKDGTGTVTIASPNTYSGGTNLNTGTITLSGIGTLGAATSALTVAGGTLNLGGTSQTVGSLLVSGAAIIQNGTLTAPALTATIPTGSAEISASLDLGTGGISKSGPGNLILSGTSAYSGATTISGGTLSLSGVGSLGSASAVTLSGGALDLGGTSQFTGGVTISAAVAMGETIFNGTIVPTSFSATNAAGLVATVSANIEGSTGVSKSGGGVLSLTGDNTFSGPVNFAGNGTISIDGGTNTGGGAITYNSFGSTFTINAASFVTSGITTNGLSEFRFLNLNAGSVLESFGNIFANTLAVSIVIDGGTLRSVNPAGISVFDYNNQVQVNGGGATFDTTDGPITVGNNQNMFATGNVIIPTLNRPGISGTAGGTITLTGGNTLTAGITSSGLLDIQDNSTLDLNGVGSSIAGLQGDGTVTSSAGSAVLTINVASPFSYSGTIAGGGAVSLVKQGAAIQTLTGSNSYQGDITITEGTLEVTDNSATSFSDNAVISIAAPGTLHLPVDATDVVAGLVINGSPLIPGTYDANSAETSGFITGLGKIQVGAGFANWMSQFSSVLSEAQRLAGADPDADGIPNLVEFALADFNPLSTDSLAGAFTGLTLSFNKRAEALPFVTYGMDVSTDLGANDPWTVIDASDPRVTDNDSIISYTFNLATDGPRDFVRLKVVGN